MGVINTIPRPLADILGAKVEGRNPSAFAETLAGTFETSGLYVGQANPIQDIVAQSGTPQSNVAFAKNFVNEGTVLVPLALSVSAIVTVGAPTFRVGVAAGPRPFADTLLPILAESSVEALAVGFRVQATYTFNYLWAFTPDWQFACMCDNVTGGGGTTATFRTALVGWSFTV